MGMLIVPPTIVLDDASPGELLHASVTVWDSYPAPGLQMSVGKVSDNTRIKAALRLLSPSEQEHLRSSEQNYVTGALSPRYAIEVAYKVPREDQYSEPFNAERANLSDEFYLDAIDQTVPRVLVPIVCRLKHQAYTVSPATISISKSLSGQRIDRTLRIIANSPQMTGFVVSHVPDGFTVEIDNITPHEFLVRVSGVVPSNTDQFEDSLAFMLKSDKNEVTSIPFRMVDF
jgi:hypothetical protein